MLTICRAKGSGSAAVAALLARIEADPRMAAVWAGHWPAP